MAKLTKTFLVLGAASAVPGLVIDAGLVSVTNVEGLYVLLPIGVTLLGMFFISRLIDKATAAGARGWQAAQSAAEKTAREGTMAAKAKKEEAAQPAVLETTEAVTEQEEHELQHH